MTSEKTSLVYNVNNRSISSRKVEFLMLSIPTSGVLGINQLVIIASLLDDFIGNFEHFIGVQWYWQFKGVDQTLTYVNTLGDIYTVTTNIIIIINIGFITQLVTSAVDVIHAIALPGLWIKLDSIPGRLSCIFCSTNILGKYIGQCSELCGAMHSYMPLTIIGI